MAEKKGVGHAYNVDFLNVVFAASSLFLFLSVIWMVWDDYDRDWKNTQRGFAQLEFEVTRRAALRQAAAQDRPGQAGAELRQRSPTARRRSRRNQQKVDELQGADRRSRRAALSRDAGLPVHQGHLRLRPLRSSRSSRHAGFASAERKRSAGRRHSGTRVNELNLIVEKTTAERAALNKAARGRSPASWTTTQKQIDELNAEHNAAADAGRACWRRARSRTTSAMRRCSTSWPRRSRSIRSSCPTCVDDVNFTTVPKMDRCTTCHLAIDRVGYEKYPQPFTTHPNLISVPRQRVAAPDRSGRLHGVPRRDGAVGELP